MIRTPQPHDQTSVLDLVRAALGRESTLTPDPLEPFVEPEERADSRDVVSRFESEATAVMAQVRRVSGNLALVEELTRICVQYPGDVALSDSETFREIDLSSNLTKRGVSTFTANDTDHHEVITCLGKCAVGVTSADCGIAETGTLVLSSDEQNALLVSLLPPVHVALIRASRIIASLDGTITKLNCEQHSRSVSFITGPSRTGDVELVLSIGVHGPKELHIIILEKE